MQRQRICFVVTELLGLERNGGIGTAITHMALVLARHGHLIDILHCGRRHEVEEPWASRYREAGVNVRILDRSVSVQPERTGMSWSAYQVLKHEDYDAIVFQDWLGAGCISMLAKQAGAAFASTTLVHHVHGPTEWTLEANRNLELDAVEAMLCHMERVGGELADVVVSPSQYLLDWLVDRGWQLPERRYVIPLFTSANTRDLAAPLAPDRVGEALTELVFFGRLEERKGVRTFVEAVNRLGRDRVNDLTVTFLGRPAHFGVDEVRSWFDPVVAASLAPIRFFTDFDQPQARAYLQEPGRLAVMPSRIDNSPNVVYECIEDRVPFVASAAGGTAELVHPDDRSLTLFEPTSRALADHLGPWVDQRRVPPSARPTFDGVSTLAAWNEVFAPIPPRIVLHEQPLVSAIVPTRDRPRFLRQAVDSLGRQHYPNIEIVVVDDGSELPSSHEALDRLKLVAGGHPLTIVRQPNRYLGAARNAGAAAARGELFTFLDDDDLATPDYVSSLVKAAFHAEADAVTCTFEMVEGLHDQVPRPQHSSGVWVYLGGPISLTPFVNVLGGAGMLVRKAMFEKVGGFHERYGVGHEDFQLLVKVAVCGGRIATVPDPIYRYRSRPEGMLGTTNRYENVRVVNEIFLPALPRELTDWPKLLRGFHERVLSADHEIDELRDRLHDLEVELDNTRRWVELVGKSRPS